MGHDKTRIRIRYPEEDPGVFPCVPSFVPSTVVAAAERGVVGVPRGIRGRGSEPWDVQLYNALRGSSNRRAFQSDRSVDGAHHTNAQGDARSGGGGEEGIRGDA